MAGSDRALISGVPELLMLQLLARRTMYGYELAQQVRLASRDTLDFGESVLYPTLHSLEQSGLLRTRERKVENRARIYYELTAKGKRRLADLTAEWRRISRGVDAVLAGGANG
jgi:PadR family transcriptional regulator, regulatory protein PadR